MTADRLIADKAFDADARVLEPLARAGKSAVINEPVVRVETQCLVSKMAINIRRDDEAGNPEAITLELMTFGAIDGRRDLMIVKSSPIVPCNQYYGVVVVRRLHDSVDQARHIVHAIDNVLARMLADAEVRNDGRLFSVMVRPLSRG
jgi:hypothetical protein